MLLFLSSFPLLKKLKGDFLLLLLFPLLLSSVKEEKKEKLIKRFEINISNPMQL